MIPVTLTRTDSGRPFETSVSVASPVCFFTTENATLLDDKTASVLVTLGTVVWEDGDFAKIAEELEND